MNRNLVIEIVLGLSLILFIYLFCTTQGLWIFFLALIILASLVFADSYTGDNRFVKKFLKNFKKFDRNFFTKLDTSIE